VARRKQTNNSNSMDQLLAETSEAVGRLIQSTFTTRKIVRQGDQVASSLDRP